MTEDSGAVTERVIGGVFSEEVVVVVEEDDPPPLTNDKLFARAVVLPLACFTNRFASKPEATAAAAAAAATACEPPLEAATAIAAAASSSDILVDDNMERDEAPEEDLGDLFSSEATLSEYFRVKLFESCLL